MHNSARILIPLLCGATLFAQDASFTNKVKPIFEAKCVACHGAVPQGKLDLRTPEAVLKGGASGPTVVAGDAAKSLLIDKLVTSQMPPGKVKLTAAEIDQIRFWIDKDLRPVPVVEAAVREQDAHAVLQARCVICHGSGQKMGGLDLRTVASRLKGGKSGPALVPGKPEESLMYKRIAKGEMPPDKMAKDLAVELVTPNESETIRAWIASGAPAPLPIAVAADAIVKKEAQQFWSFQPPVRPSVPTSKNQALVKNPIDAFLLQKLEAKNMSFAKQADRLALMRRAYLDLIGLLPTKAQINAYLNDKSPDAYEKLVDQLLASPHYGERWGQHWLDLAGYSDSEGFGQDDGVRPYAWRYRDYVIRSLNQDKPYAQFLTEQIAGDEMSNDWKSAKGTANQQMIDRLAATGFLRTVPDPTNSNERGLIAERMNIVADEVEVLTSSVMGLTVGCARCHNHKYDPIPQRDYYRISAILQGAYDPYEWKTPNKREFPLALESEVQESTKHNEPIEAELKKVQEELKKVGEPFQQLLIEERLAALPADVREDLRAANDTADEKRTDLQKYLVAKFKSTFEINNRELSRKYPDLQAKTQPLQRQIGEIRGKLTAKPHIRILTDNEEPSIPYLLRRGDPVGFGDPVEPGVPAVLTNANLKPYQPVSPFAGATGRRLALANWLTQPNHPLTARVAVNQIWMRHFGRGIVPTVSNFGHSGIAPSHPELLDWLATEFVKNGWSMKSMHRLMMTSQAYRQESRSVESVITADPENALLSRMPFRRMDAETLYDSLITAAGRLDPTSLGPPTDIEVGPDKEVTVKASKTGFRRAIFVLHRRQTPVSLLDSFDQPPMTPNCTERRRSNVATQALHMMNGSMTWELARYMAGRVVDEADGDRSKLIENVYLRAYSRAPSDVEITEGLAAIDEFRKQWPARLESDNSDAPRSASAQWMAVANYCHAILNSAEFSFID